MSLVKYTAWMKEARVVGERSKCLSRKLGAILVTPDGVTISTGYNGPPRGVPHCDSTQRRQYLRQVTKNTVVLGSLDVCPRKLLGFKSGEGLQYCSAAHAERNALLNVARQGGVPAKGCTLITASPLPCFECAKEIINAGVIRVVSYTGEYDPYAMWLFDQAGVEVIIIPNYEEA